MPQRYLHEDTDKILVAIHNHYRKQEGRDKKPLADTLHQALNSVQRQLMIQTSSEAEYQDFIDERSAKWGQHNTSTFDHEGTYHEDAANTNET